MHGFSEEVAKHARVNFNLNKTRGSGKTKRTYKRYHCAVEGCTLIPKRIHDHLSSTHQLGKGREYQKYLNKSKNFPYVQQKEPSSESSAIYLLEREKEIENFQKAEENSDDEDFEASLIKDENSV